MQERLQKFLARAGVASRRKAEQLILDGRVKVNGVVVRRLGSLIDPRRDRVEYHGRAVQVAEPAIYAFNKPVGVTSTVSDSHAKKTIADFFPKENRVYPVGRLDKNSDGLILVTNDGELANLLTHPRYQHEKEYEVIVAGSSADKIIGFKKSYRTDGSLTQPMRVVGQRILARGRWLVRLVLKEGKKRQIREVAERLGYKVVRLTRVRIGKLRLGKLAPGEWREVQRDNII
ncbi:MAG: pseudouridine synthase [bacterium]